MIRAQGGVRSHRRATVESVRYYCLQVVVVAECWWFRASRLHEQNDNAAIPPLPPIYETRTYTETPTSGSGSCSCCKDKRHPPLLPSSALSWCALVSSTTLSPPLKGSLRVRIGSGPFRPRTTPALNATLPVTPTSQSSARLNPSRTAGPAGASDTTAGAYLQDSGLCSATAVSHCLARSCNLPSIWALCGLAIATAEVPPHVACFISCTPLV